MKNSKKKPLVSVVIPTYNRAELLPCALDSVLAQDYPNIEVIVVDDGSTDNTQKVIQSYSHQQSPSVTFWKKEHKGQCSARNAGLDIATGKYIQMLDSDDALFPGVIKKHVEFLESHPEIDLVYGDMMISNTHVMNHPEIKESVEFHPDVRKGSLIYFPMKEVLIKNLSRPFSPVRSVLTLYVPQNNAFANYLHISTGTALFKKTDVRYDPVIERIWNCSADVDFWGQLIFAGFQFFYLPGLVLEYRVHSKNITNRAGVGTDVRKEARRYIFQKLCAQAHIEPTLL